MYKEDAQTLEERFLEKVSDIPWDMYEDWKMHPCTKALLSKLELDQTGAFEDWMNDTTDAETAKWLIRYTTVLQEVVRNYLGQLEDKDTYDEEGGG